MAVLCLEKMLKLVPLVETVAPSGKLLPDFFRIVAELSPDLAFMPAIMARSVQNPEPIDSAKSHEVPLPLPPASRMITSFINHEVTRGGEPFRSSRHHSFRRRSSTPNSPSTSGRRTSCRR